MSSIVTQRRLSYFNDDVINLRDEISEKVFRKKILILGASGFISTQTIKILITYEPKSIVVVDINENSLTELIRELRNQFNPDALPEIYPILMDITNKDILLIPKLHPDIDVILNFAAVKHVRSERDPISLARMFNVNILGMFSIIDLANKLPNLNSIFSVSTDKAANPVSFMGASKRLMELILFSSLPTISSSARFANVCFSTGSLLESWLKRISKGEPVATPKDTLRYFISPEESGQLCLMASTVPNKGLISVPTLAPEKDLQNLETVLLKILDYLGLEPVHFINEKSALENSLKLSEIGKQAVLITDRDTSGEKSFEEFLGKGEVIHKFKPSINVISTTVIQKDYVNSMRVEFEGILKNFDRTLSFQPFFKAVSIFIPEFQHLHSKKSLDSRL